MIVIVVVVVVVVDSCIRLDITARPRPVGLSPASPDMEAINWSLANWKPLY